MKVTAILKGMIDSNGHQPIQIRINQGKKKTFKPTHIKVDPKLFEKGKIKPAHPKSREHNKTIENLILQYQAQAIEGFKKKTPRTDFYQFVNKTMRHLTRADGTHRYYGSQERKLKKFAPTLHLDQIDKDFLNEYKLWLEARDNNPNTVWAAFKYLKTFYNIALDDGLVTSNPFKKVKVPYVNPDKTYLTSEEVKKIDKFIKDKKQPPALVEAGTWFLIACYTGLRISDIIRFDKKIHIHGGRLVIRTQKTKDIVGLPIDDRLKGYFQRVGWLPLSMHVNTYNKLIKVIASAVGIDKHISTHSARHTAGMLLANAGVSQEVAARILGHSSLKSTSIYYKISNIRIDNELKKLK
jgi:integrase/recombinase XerD